ncbi:MAG: sugar transferase [Balneolaceae bacterium]|nr:sugar transferase [Balneolaceae bacterium]
MDYLIVLAGWFVFHYYYTDSINEILRAYETNFATGGIWLSFYWVFMFVITGLYKKLYLVSRLDEFFKVLKSTALGTLILYFLLDISSNEAFERVKILIVLYWGFTFGISALNRFVIRTVQRFYARRGKGLHRTVIIGTGYNAKVAYDDLMRNKTLGMDVMGYVQVNGKAPDPTIGIDKEQVIGHLDDIDEIINQNQIQDVLVAIEPDRRSELVEVISKVDKPEVTLKLLPDFYQLVSGLNKTNQIFGLPFIEISPQPMPLWERLIKRLLDVTVSIVVLIAGAPLFIAIALIIKSTSKGPAIYAQERVGRNGKPFTMFKFRTMYQNAEAKSGPMWAQENDPRVTKVGYWLRKMRLDEIPQLLNVLAGSMSLVGPRPERPHFVDQFKVQIPLYTRRLRVRPGITGWAQVKWKYDTSLDDVKEKTKYDLYYIENISLRMDMKILIATILTMVKGKGQ